MSDRRRSLTVLLPVVQIAALLTAAVMGALARSASDGPQTWGSGFAAVVVPVALLAYPLVGGLIVRRRPGHPIGWLLLASGLAWSFTWLADGLGSLHPDGAVALWVGSLGWWVPAVGLAATVLLQIFPDGHTVTPRWRPVLWLSSATIGLVFVLVTTAPVFATSGARVNPYDVAAIRPIVVALTPSFALFPACIVASVVSLIVRYRRAGTDARMQIKWLGYAGLALAVVYGVTVALVFTTEGPDGVPMPVALLQDATFLSYGAVPAAVGFAVLRYRLYDIDRLIRRTVTYAVVSGVLVAAYLGLVLATSGLARSLTGSTQVAVAGSTLIVATLFRPLLRRTRSRIDHRFNRARYDAEQTIDAFVGHLRREVDIDSLETELRDAIARTMQPSFVSLWLRPR